MNKEKYIKLLKTFIPSVEMQKYLADIELNDEQLLNIILGAPVPLETKLKWTTGNEHNEIQQALDALKLKEDEHFYLFDNWYDEEFFGYEEFPNRPFYDFNSVLEHIRGEITDCGEDYDETSWYTLRKMVHAKNNTKHKTSVCLYEYILINDEVCYFYKDDGRFYTSTYLNLPVPFKVGDIVNIDCRPFAPVKEVTITSVGDNIDSYSLQAEYYDENDKKNKTGAVKNCFIFSKGYLPLLSPLYRISKVN